MNLRPRRPDPPRVDITPLIDVVFLMLIFFMVSTTFDKQTRLKVDLPSAETIERELLLAKIDDPHIHFLAKEGVNLGRLHVANLLQRSDLLHGFGIGMVAGGITGALAGVVLSFYPQLGQAIGMGGILVLAVVCAMIGSWISGMIAISLPNSRLRHFQPAIDRGEILLMVDVPVRRVREIRDLIMSHHPEAQAKGQDTQIPAFP